MLHKITDGDNFVYYATDKVNDEINIEMLKMLNEGLFKEQTKENKGKTIDYRKFRKKNKKK